MNFRQMDTIASCISGMLLLSEKELTLETEENRNFFEAWERESESTLLFLQENGKAITADGTKMLDCIFQVSFCWI